MKNKLIAYLKKNNITDTKQVNRLLITSFISVNKINVNKNRLILEHLIASTDSYEKSLLSELLSLLKKEFESFGFEELINLFEFVISPSDRIVNGAVYTPNYIRDYIVKTSIESNKINEAITIADISCGCGGFLFTACNLLKEKLKKSYSYIFENNIYGIDIQSHSVERTKLLLTLLALSNGEDRGEFSFNVHIGNSLSFQWNTVINSFKGFDIILGNPPYVCSRNLSTETKSLLKRWSVSSSGNSDLYIPFFQIGIENLSINGVLGYITMNSFFKSLNGRALRKYFHDNNIYLKIYDFGYEQIFNSKSTYTCLCFIKKVNKGYIEYSHINSSLLRTQRISVDRLEYTDLNHLKGWNLRNNILMQRIESVGRPLGEIFKTRHGIATLKNSVYIFKPSFQDNKYYYLERHGIIFQIEKDVCRDIINSNKLVKNYSLDELTEKIIFPYTMGLNPKIIPEEIFKKLYPFAYKYLLTNRAILRTRDKGKREYSTWYAYGRTQSLQPIKNKLFLPKITNSSPCSIISSDEDLMFYNGIAIVGCSYRELSFIQKIIESRLFWYYISTTSKPYSSGYFSLNGNYINNFGVYPFSDDEIDYIISEKDYANLNNFIEEKYGVNIFK